MICLCTHQLLRSKRLCVRANTIALSFFLCLSRFDCITTVYTENSAKLNAFVHFVFVYLSRQRLQYHALLIAGLGWLVFFMKLLFFDDSFNIILETLGKTFDIVNDSCVSIPQSFLTEDDGVSGVWTKGPCVILYEVTLLSF